MSARLSAMGLPGWLLLMGALTAIGPVSIDMYLPAFPEMAANLGATGSQVERTLAAYLIGMAGAQLIYGPLGVNPLCMAPCWFTFLRRQGVPLPRPSNF